MYSILAVDDEKANLAVLNRILSPEYSVHLAKSGVQALGLVAEHRPDLILLDIIMPEMDGFAVLAQLKGSPATRGIPVIIITGLNAPVDEERGFTLGADDYIAKPFKPVVIKARVDAQIKRAATAQAEYYNKAKSDFLSRMSHEMRTPLNAITGMAAIARGADSDSRRAYCFDMIDEASRQLLELIDNILDMANIDSGHFELVPRSFSFKKTVRRIIADSSVEAKAKRQDFTFAIDPAIPDALVADERRLKQALTHLLSNAVKFTPEGGSVSFTATRAAPQPEMAIDDCVIWFEVKDSGPGISDELKERLWSAFEQVDNSITRAHGGTGLGLAISKRIVQMMGGTIGVVSKPGEGACFTCTVTVKMERGGEQDEGDQASGAVVETSPDDSSRDDSSRLAGRRILVVDDVEINREIIFALLEDSGALLDGAEDGAAAVEKIHQTPCDLVLMDLHMPGMDGFEAARRIRDSGLPGARTLPIIAVTADTGGDVVSRCIQAGMNGHIGKPIDQDRLISAIVNNLLTP